MSETDGDFGNYRMTERDRHVIDEILYPARPQEKRGIVVNEGYRFICLGETGSGKTSLQRAVLYTTLARKYAEFALIHDVKGVFPEYPKSIQLPDVPTFQARGLRHGDIPAYSFRGDPRTDARVTAEDVASFGKLILQKGQEDATGRWIPRPIVVVIEELAALATTGRKYIASESAVWFLEQGRKVGGSLIGTTQSPRKTPLDFYGQSSSIAFFRLTSADANYLGDVLELPSNMIDVIRGPNNEGLPDFKFVLYCKGKPWDGEVYSLDKRLALMFE